MGRGDNLSRVEALIGAPPAAQQRHMQAPVVKIQWFKTCLAICSEPTCKHKGTRQFHASIPSSLGRQKLCFGSIRSNVAFSPLRVRTSDYGKRMPVVHGVESQERLQLFSSQALIRWCTTPLRGRLQNLSFAFCQVKRVILPRRGRARLFCSTCKLRK